MENNYWVGVILGGTLGIILSLVGLFCIIKQNDDIQGQVLELRAKVAEHEEVIRQYEFYVWHNMKFFDEKESE